MFLRICNEINNRFVKKKEVDSYYLYLALEFKIQLYFFLQVIIAQ